MRAERNRAARRSSSPGWVVWNGGGPRARVGGALRSGGRIAAGLVLATLLHARQDPALEREWTTRAAALDAPAHAGGLAADLASGGWRSRVAALDALARAACLGERVPPTCGALVVAALEDPHPNVRARALAAATGLASAPPVAPLDAAARDRLPVVRLALARALPELAAARALPAPDAAARLASLVRDPDSRVAVAARSGLLALDGQDPRVRAHQLAWLVTALTAPGPEALEAAHRLVRSAPPSDLVDAVVAEALERGGVTPVLAALAWALGEAPSAARTPGALLVGWDTDLEPRLETLLAQAARSRDGTLARAVLRALEALAPDDPRQAAWIDLFVDLVGAPAVAALLHEVDPPPRITALVLEELGRRLDALAEETFAPWGAADQPPEVRRALLGTAGAIHARTQDPGSRRLLAGFLEGDEPTLAGRAFAALCGGTEADPDVDAALHAAWRALGDAQRAARLSDFTRGRAFEPFREDWLALGARGGAARRTACELLAPFGQDAALATAVESWLEADLVRLAEGGATRALEFEVQADLRALRALAAPELVAPFARALDVALGRSTEVGKVACAALGRGVEGCAHLAARLASGALAGAADRRTRIEAAIVLARRGDERARPAAVAQLIADHDAAAPDLLERMLDALAASREPGALAALAAWALDPTLESAERVGVLARLAQVRAPGTLDTAEAAARSRLDLETRRAGLRALGALGGPEAAARLAALLEVWFPPGSGPGGERARSGLDEESAVVVRGDLLEALALTGHVPRRLERAWLAGPLGQAASDLDHRLAGEDLAAIAFRWRAELALAPALVRAGRLPAALDASGEWWRIDASFLLALGERLATLDDAAARETARRVLRASLVGLAGEAEPPVALTVRARVALLDLEWRAERFAAAARLAGDLLAQRRSGEADAMLWTRLFGAVDAHTGHDPGARLAEREREARARAR